MMAVCYKGLCKQLNRSRQGITTLSCHKNVQIAFPGTRLHLVTSRFTKWSTAGEMASDGGGEWEMTMMAECDL